MYKNGKVKVTINNRQLFDIISIKIENDSAVIGTTCHLLLPLKVRVKMEGQYLTDSPKNLFKTGDTIKIEAAYEKNTALTVFEGFVNDYEEGTPLKMRCFDLVYNLKKKEVEKSWKTTVKLKEIIDYILEGTGVVQYENNYDRDFDRFTISKMSASQALTDLKKVTPGVGSLINKKFWFNLTGIRNRTISLQTDRDVSDKNTKLQKKDGVYKKYKVVVNIKNADGTMGKFESGDKEGELITLNLGDMPDTKKRDELIKSAKKSMEFNNYKGNISLYLYPEVDALDAIEFKDIRYPERSGTYIVKSMELSLDADGFSRVLNVAEL